MSFGDPLDLDGYRFDRAFDALEPLVIGRWRKLMNRPGSDEPPYEGTPERKPNADGEDGDDSGLDEVEQIGVGHGWLRLGGRGTRDCCQSAGLGERHGALALAGGEETGQETLALRDALDFHGDRLDRALHAIEAIGVLSGAELRRGGIRLTEPLRVRARYRQDRPQRNDRDDARREEVFEFSGGHNGLQRRIQTPSA